MSARRRPTRRLLVAAAALVATATLGLVAALGGAGAGAGAATAATSAPFSDPNAVGYLGLCNSSGQQITSGNINTTPFVWRAVSSEAAARAVQQRLADGDPARLPAPQRPRRRRVERQRADCLQPVLEPGPPDGAGDRRRRLARGLPLGLPPGLGRLHPAADVPRDPGAQVYSLHYPALDLQITGDTWHAVGGGPVDCTAGKAVSIESIVLPKSDTSTTTTAPGGHGAAGGTSTSTTTSGSTEPSGTGTGASHPAPTGDGSKAAAGVTGSTTSGSSDHLPLVLLAAALVLLVGGGAYLLGRRRRPESIPPTSASNRRNSTKGQ